MLAVISFLSAITGILVGLVMTLPSVLDEEEYQNKFIAAGVALLVTGGLGLFLKDPWGTVFLVASFPCSFMTCFYAVLYKRISDRIEQLPEPPVEEKIDIDAKINEILDRNRRS